MARPLKEGLDYFPLDVVLDEKWEYIEAEFGLVGFSVVVKLLQKIYGGHGYYCDADDDMILLFSRKVNLTPAEVKDIISASVKRGIFDKDMYEAHKILTSKGIQKRYFDGVGRRKDIATKTEFLLAETPVNVDNNYNNSINVDNNSINVDNNSQSKVKESKEKKSKEESAGARTHEGKIADFVKRQHEGIQPRGKFNNVLLTDDEFESLRKHGIPSDYILDYFSERLYKGGYFLPDHAKSIWQWWDRDRVNPQWNKVQTGTFDTDEFFEKALKRSFTKGKG